MFCSATETMNMALNLLKELHPRKDNWKIRVRVFGLWTHTGEDSTDIYSLNMVLIDEEVVS